jgi:flagellar assembly protein FliH
MAMNKTSFQGLEVLEVGHEGVSVALEELNETSQPQVKPFEFQDLVHDRLPEYEEVKDRFGSLAMTDVERASKSAKDRKFHLHQHTKKSLSVQDEELRVIREMVNQEVQEVSGAAQKEGFQQGYEEGVRQGREAAYAEIKAHGESQLAQIKNFLNAAESAKFEIYKTNEKILMQLIFRLSKMILLRELKQDRQYLERLVESLIKEAHPKEYLVIRVHPDDLEVIQILEPEIKTTLQHLNQIKIETSLQVPVGGCHVETVWIHIESEIETQLKSIEKALFGGGEGP